MIHVFNCCIEACALPGKVCAQCGTCCKDLNCQELCEPCVFACEQCNASLNEFLNKPLGGFVFMAFWLGGLEAASAGYAVYKVDALSKCSFREETFKSIGLLNWLYVQCGMAFVHLIFAPYVQCRLWAKLKEPSEMDPSAGRHVVATKATIKESFAHVFLHDIGVCLYVFLLVFSFWWSQKGLELTSTACSFGDFWFTPWRAASLGICMFWFVPIYAMGWWCYISCMAAKDGMTISGYNQAIYHRPDQAEKLRDDASQQPPKQESMLERAKRATARANGSEVPQAEPTGPKKGLSKACSPSQMAKLLACIGLDVMGNATYLLPGVGEGVDIAYAPAQAVALKMMFDANGIALIGFAEELLPFTDVLPTATIAWVIETFFPDSILGRLLGIQQT